MLRKGIRGAAIQSTSDTGLERVLLQRLRLWVVVPRIETTGTGLQIKRSQIQGAHRKPENSTAELKGPDHGSN